MVMFIFILGLVIGSFLNVCIYRIPKEESIAYPPSHCGICHERIKVYDLIPVLSWVFLRGKCRKCRQKISIRYPLIEVFAAITYLLIYFKYGYTIIAVQHLIIATFLIIIAMIDYDTTDVYSCTTWIAIGIEIIFMIIYYFYGQEYLTYIIGGGVGFGIIALIILLTGGMGWGDAEITLIGGLLLGWQITLMMLIFSFVIGGGIGGMLIVTKKKTREDYMPFGPSIVAAIFICILWGDSILNWYINTFF